MTVPPASPSYDHLILTRFAIRATPDSELPSREWLDYRLALFRAVCLPSVLTQTDGNFQWLVLCDEDTDPSFLDTLEASLADAPTAQLLLTSRRHPYLGAVLDRSEAASDVLITTRLDNDDALGPAFVERTASYVESFVHVGRSAQLLCFSQGVKLDASTGQVYDSPNPSSPILTLFERREHSRPLTTVLAGNHWYLSHAYPMHHDCSEAPWLMVLHGGNVMNGKRDWDYPVAKDALEPFTIIEQHLPEETVAAPQPDDRKGAADFRFGLERPASDPLGSSRGRPPNELTR